MWNCKKTFCIGISLQQNLLTQVSVIALWYSKVSTSRGQNSNVPFLEKEATPLSQRKKKVSGNVTLAIWRWEITFVLPMVWIHLFQKKGENAHLAIYRWENTPGSPKCELAFGYAKMAIYLWPSKVGISLWQSASWNTPLDDHRREYTFYSRCLKRTFGYQRWECIYDAPNEGIHFCNIRLECSIGRPR